MTIGAGEVQLSSFRIVEALARLVGLERAGFVGRDRRIDFAAPGLVGKERRDVDHAFIGEVPGLNVVLFATPVDRQRQSQDAAQVTVEAWIPRTNARRVVTQAVGQRFAVGKSLDPQLTAALHRELIRRKILDGLPLRAGIRIQCVNTVGKLVERHTGKALLVVSDKGLSILLGTGLGHGRHEAHGQGSKREQAFAGERKQSVSPLT